MGEEEIEIYDFANDSCRKERHTSEVSFLSPPPPLPPRFLPADEEDRSEIKQV